MTETNGDKIKLHERLATLETKMETILTNHLPHIQIAVDKLGVRFDKKIDKLGNKFWGVIILLIANLVALVFSLIV